MALVKETLQADLVKMLQEAAQEIDQAQGIQNFAGNLATAIDTYIKTASIVSTPAQVTLAVMTNSGGPVVAASNLISTIQ